jgi:hypothetical protein
MKDAPFTWDAASRKVIGSDGKSVALVSEKENGPLLAASADMYECLKLAQKHFDSAVSIPVWLRRVLSLFYGKSDALFMVETKIHLVLATIDREAS